MSTYSTVAKEIVQETRFQEDGLRLMNDNCRSRFFLHPSPTTKVCLFFHGFTATPEQFVPIGEAFFKAGYNVLIPLLPGHGIAGDWNQSNPPPLPEKQQTYERFGIHWLKLAPEFGKEIIVGGLSGGSTLAAWLALKHPEEIYRALVFAPYLSGSNILVDAIVRTFNIYFQWRTKPGAAHFGYDGFVMPALRLFLDMGEDVLKLAEKRQASPMLIVSSESDTAVGSDEHQTLFQSALQRQPQCWYHCFDKDLHIGHNMMTLAEGNKHLDLLLSLAKAYVESDLSWAEVQEIRSRVLRGISFPTAVAQLNLSQRVSPDMSALMAMFTDIAR